MDRYDYNVPGQVPLYTVAVSYGMCTVYSTSLYAGLCYMKGTCVGVIWHHTEHNIQFVQDIGIAVKQVIMI